MNPLSKHTARSRWAARLPPVTQRHPRRPRTHRECSPTWRATEVAFPATVERIAEEWPAHTVIVELLGAGEKLVAVNKTVKPPAAPFLQKVNPQIASLPAVFTSGEVNQEELLNTDPDIVLAFTDSPPADAVQQRDTVPVFRLGFTTYPT